MLINVESVGPVNVARAGPAPGVPLVFLHPVGLDLTWWGDQFKAFGAVHDVLALDLPGHGLSTGLNSSPTFELMADAVAEVLDSAGGRPATLVGLSVGGMIAQRLALRRPDLVRSLVLVGTLCTFPGDVRTALRDRAQVARTQGMGRIAELSNERWFTAEFRARRPDMLVRTTLSLLQQPAEFHARMWEMIAGFDIEDEIGAIRVPTVVVTGEADINAPPAAAHRIADAIPGAKAKIMPRLGHFPPFEAPDAFNELLRAFLSEASA